LHRLDDALQLAPGLVDADAATQFDLLTVRRAARRNIAQRSTAA
jgi:hypothetical protein